MLRWLNCVTPRSRSRPNNEGAEPRLRYYAIG
ncbi:hypothetical protein GGI60_002603 [Rhizobium lentis]|nr:hypothetical protein [Rhizobium lentis]